jgi:hypothetical protein
MMFRYPVYESLEAAGNTGMAYECSKKKGAADLERAYRITIMQAIRIVLSELGHEADIATALVIELKLAEELKDWEIREKIANMLFGFIVYPALNKWLNSFISWKNLSQEEFEDLIGDAILKICELKYDPSIRPFLAWVSTVAKWPWIDYLRKSMQMAKYNVEIVDWETLEEYQLYAPEPLEISEETKELLLSVAKKPEDVSVLEAVFAGIPWRNTTDISWWTGLATRRIDKAKADIKKEANRSGIYALLRT